MMAIATPRCRNARRSRRSSIGRGGARPDTQITPQLDRSSSINPAAFDRTNRLIHRNHADQCARSPRHNSDALSAALKSP
jgi:hypothetical protein